MSNPNRPRLAFWILAGIPAGAILGLWLAGFIQTIHEWRRYDAEGDQQ